MTVGLAIVGCGALTRIVHVPVLATLGSRGTGGAGGAADLVRAAAGESSGAEMSGEEGLRDLAVVDAAVRSVTSGRLEQVFTVS